MAADGQLVRAGGKVMKNVAGYDLVKLYIGSHGTLGIIVEATLKLQPRPEAEGACWATFPALEPAARAAAALAASELGPVALTLLDPQAAEACGRRAGLASRATPAVLAVFDGLARAVSWKQEEAARRLGAGGAEAVELLDASAAARALGAVREVRRVVDDPIAVATVGVLPADVLAYLEAAAAAARTAGIRLAAVAHAGHGLVTLIFTATGRETPPTAATVAALGRCREIARARAGQLMLEWAPLGVREACAVWEDVPAPALALMRGIKARLDPQGVLNPGRFVGGI